MAQAPLALVVVTSPMTTTGVAGVVWVVVK